MPKLHKAGYKTVLAATVFVLGAAAGFSGASAEPKAGGVVTAVVNPDPTFLVSAHNPVGGALNVSSKMFEGLLTYDIDMNLKPALAESYEVAPDGLSITFHLRKGVKWHDGTPFTSKDVAFTAMKIWKALHPRNRVTMSKLSAVETPDDLTAVFRLSQPAPYLMSILNSGESQVVPQHVYDGEDVAKNMIEKSPVGTGPFKLKEWRKGQAIILERNPEYWQAGKPYLDGISFRVIQDEGARATAFETGEVQYGVLNPVSPCAAKRLSSLPNIEIDKRGYQFFGTRYLLELNLRNPILADKRVRQALAHSIDRQFILKNIWCGNGTLSTGPVPPQLKQFYTADVATYDFNPKKAEELLDAAGYKRGADGIRFKMTHDPLPFGPDYMRTAEVMKQNLKAVGIDVEIRSQDTPTWLRRIYTDNDFDMTSNTLSALPDPTLGVQRVYWSKNIVKGVPFSNSSGYSNPEMDKVLEAAQSEIDPEARKQLFYKMQKIAQDDLPVIDIFVADWNTVHAKTLKNVTTTADGYSTLADAYFEK